MDEHVILVAFTVEGKTRQSAMIDLMGVLPEASEVGLQWWIAEDDRIDGSDNDSAVFCHPGQQGVASHVLHVVNLTSKVNREIRTDNIF